MKRWREVFELTPAQQRLIIVVLLVLVVSAAVKQHRNTERGGPPQSARPTEEVQPSLSPGIRP